MHRFLSSRVRVGVYGWFFLVGCVLGWVRVEAADRNVTWPPAVVGTPYLHVFTSEAGFSEPYIWEVSTSTVTDVLPPGLFGMRMGAREIKVYGTPRQAGTYQFTIAPYSSTRESLPTTLVTLQVRTEPTLPHIVNGTGSRIGTVGVPFSLEPVVRVEDGAAPYQWRVLSGGLPSGLSFNSEGAIQGTATVAGTYLFQAEVSDASGFRAATSVTVMVSEGTSSSSVSGVFSPVSPAAIPVSSLSYADRLQVLGRLGVVADSVLRTDSLDPLMLRPLHYYVGGDGRRHVFQSDAVYYSWYPSANANVSRTMSVQDIASIPLGEPMTYRPGERVRFRTDMNTYGIGNGKTMWRLPSDQSTVSGWTWERGVEELDETHFMVYRLMEGVASSLSMYDPAVVRSQYTTPNSVLSASMN